MIPGIAILSVLKQGTLLFCHFFAPLSLPGDSIFGEICSNNHPTTPVFQGVPNGGYSSFPPGTPCGRPGSQVSFRLQMPDFRLIDRLDGTVHFIMHFGQRTFRNASIDEGVEICLNNKK